MKYIYSPDYEVDIGSHVFPTSKYRLIRDHLIETKLITPSQIIAPVPASTDQLLLAHTSEYLEDLDNLARTERTAFSELPLTLPIIEAYKLAAGGTILACRAALGIKPGICCHIGGGFHHAFADQAEGFCYINDIAVAIRVMMNESRIRRAAVIDCDLHQGNGTARIFQDDDTVFTVSIHQERNYPPKETSNLDIGLDDYTADDEYLAQLDSVIKPALDDFKPDLVIYVAGADPYQDDLLGKLKLTIHGLADRDRKVLTECVKRKIPVVTVTAGGYARHVQDTVKIHAQTCEIATELYNENCPKVGN